MITIRGVEGLPQITADDDLASLITQACTLADGDVLVITSKIVSKAEDRLLPALDRTDAIANEAQAALEDRALPIQVAVMGCVVNGPGEAKHADLGIAGGRKKGHLFIQGQIVRVVPEDEMVSALVDEAEKLVAEGVEARLAAADKNAEAEAAEDRAALLESKGDDANKASVKIDRIHERLGE